MRWKNFMGTFKLIPLACSMLATVAFETFGWYKLAEKTLRRRSEKWPTLRAVSLFELGSLAKERGEFRKAERLFKEAIAIDSEEAHFFAELGDVYEKCKNFQLAVANYRVAIEKKDGLSEEIRTLLREKIEQLTA